MRGPGLILVLCLTSPAFARAGEAPHFVDVTREAGLSGLIVDGGTPQRGHIPEAMPGGLAWIDYDLDGDQDLFVCTGGRGTPPAAQPGAAPGSAVRLYRNELKESGEARFTDVSEELGLVADAPGWSMGVAVADYDGDGDLDLHVTRLGPDQLLRNDLIKGGVRQERPSFVDVAGSLGVDRATWSTGSAFADVDGDGDLDFFVAGYVDFDPKERPKNPMFSHWKGVEVFPGPVGLTGAPDSFYRNELVPTGVMTFKDVSSEVGLADPALSYGFAAHFLDFDGDGDPDLYVANDSRANQLYRNDGRGHFKEIGFVTGAAHSEDGKMQAGMGAAVGDCDGDGWPDLHVTNFSYDYNTLYRNVGGKRFEDVSYAARTARAGWHDLGFGTLFLDVDADGDEDLFVANGHIYPQVDTAEFGTPHAQLNRLFLNRGPAPGSPCRYDLVEAEAGSALAQAAVSRGAAAADFDLDGDLDLVVSNLDAPISLLRNERSGGHFLAVQARGLAPNVFGIGARVTVKAGTRTQVREVRTSTSYLSAKPPRVWFGLGTAALVDVTVRFPSGREVTQKAVPADQLVVIEEPGEAPSQQP